MLRSIIICWHVFSYGSFTPILIVLWAGNPSHTSLHKPNRILQTGTTLMNRIGIVVYLVWRQKIQTPAFQAMVLRLVKNVNHFVKDETQFRRTSSKPMFHICVYRNPLVWCIQYLAHRQAYRLSKYLISDGKSFFSNSISGARSTSNFLNSKFGKIAQFKYNHTARQIFRRPYAKIKAPAQLLDR